MTFEHHFLKARNIPNPLFSKGDCRLQKILMWVLSCRSHQSFYCHASVKRLYESSWCPDKWTQSSDQFCCLKHCFASSVFGERGEEGCLIPCLTLDWWNQLQRIVYRDQVGCVKVHNCCITLLHGKQQNGRLTIRSSILRISVLYENWMSICLDFPLPSLTG